MKYYCQPLFHGIILIAIGAIIWLSNLGIIHISWRRDWPVILIALGVIEFVKYIIKEGRKKIGGVD